MKTQRRYVFRVRAEDDQSITRRFLANVDASTIERAEQTLRNGLKAKGFTLLSFERER